MENNKEPNNPWEARRVDMNRPQNLMYDIKKPTPQYHPTQTSKLETQIPVHTVVKDYEPTKSSHKKFYVILVLLATILAGVGYAAFYFYKKSNEVKEETLNDPVNQLNQAVNKIGELTILPINDNPTLSVVVDAEEAKQNELFALFRFFENAEMGDMWLSYPKTGKNILYRPTSNKIVNMMTFPPDALSSINSTSTGTSTATSTNNR